MSRKWRNCKHDMATAGGYGRMQLLGHGYWLHVVDGNDNDNVPAKHCTVLYVRDDDSRH